MTWTKINTYGLQDRFQVRTNQEPFKFNQLDNDFNNYNESIWIQSERDELNNHLMKMFYETQEWLGYYPRPIWKVIRVPLDEYFFYTDCMITIPESAYLNELGVRDTTLIEAGVTYTLSNNDTIANFTVTTSEITSGEVAFYHTSDDAFNNTADERFRVYPTNIYYNGTSYIVQIPYARLLKPELQLVEYNNGNYKDRKSYNPATTSNFVSSLDCYRAHNDSTIKAKVIGYPDNFSSETTIQEKAVDCVIMDSDNSVVKIVENDTFPSFNYTHIDLYCNIGKPLDVDGNMNKVIEEFIIRKAKVEMGINARLASAKISTQWDFDDLPAYTKGDPNSGMVGIGFMPNSIGSRNVDVSMFKAFLPIANYRGKISDSRFWIR